MRWKEERLKMENHYSESVRSEESRHMVIRTSEAEEWQKE